MNNEFNIIANLPLIVFAFFFLVVFAIFIIAGITLLRAGNDLVKREKGRRMLVTGLFSFLILLMVVAVFYGVTYLLRRGEVFRPGMSTGEMPSSPAANFPPSKEVIKIGDYYFDGPHPWEERSAINYPALYAAVCKTGGQNKVLGVDETDGQSELYSREDYQCWAANCDTIKEGLYLAIIWAPNQDYGARARKEIKQEIIKKTNPPCSILKEEGGGEI